MPDVRATHNRLTSSLLGFCFICGLVMGCQHVPPQPETAPPEYPSEKLAALESRNQELQKALASSQKKAASLEQDLSGFKIQILEKEALVNELQRRSDSQQKRLDAAIIDVVRAKAKLRSLESKAEAASTIAEAEIAVKAFKGRVASADQVKLEEILIADQLLNMSTDEFKTQNFGGALYLASQAKGQVRAGHNRLSGNKEIVPVEGETSFSQPLPLKITKKSNLRAGPDLTHKILDKLEEGTLVIGYSFKGNWIRIDTQEGVVGWIFQELVDAR